VDLTGKSAIVTGGTRGIGHAIAKALLAAGANVAITGRIESEVEIASSRLNTIGPGTVSGYVCDVRNYNQVKSLFAAFGGVDILINNAGTPATTEPIEFADLEAMTESFWQKILMTNLLGPFRCVCAAASALKASRGAIVNTASVAGLGVRGSSIAYGASKAGLVNITKNLARALAPEVRVNAVAPGLVDSPWTKSWPAERKQKIIDQTLLGRMATPADIAEAMLFLAAGGAYITGETLVVAGGLN
jgi:3-oxoacyl-[acyl-carrier protein] reductase